MEQRQSPRLSTNARLHLYRDGRPLCIGRVKAVSRSGLFVAATDITDVSPNQVLEFELPSEDQLAGRSQRGKALVVHSSNQGLGLMLQEGEHPPGMRELYSWRLRRHRNSQSRAAKRTARSLHLT